MGTGLYDAVFAALGRMYGSEARTPITNLTLFGGFASTVCWPLSAFMIEHVGADRVVLGSDYPYDMGMMDCVKHVRGLKISDADKATILSTRAQALLEKA